MDEETLICLERKYKIVKYMLIGILVFNFFFGTDVMVIPFSIAVIILSMISISLSRKLDNPKRIKRNRIIVILAIITIVRSIFIFFIA